MPELAGPLRSLTIIGCGKLGQTLGFLWATQNVFAVHQILNRSLASAERAVKFIGSGVAVSSLSQLQASDVYLLAAPDDQISAVATELAASACIKPGILVFHCSGALPSTILQVLKSKGALIASVHPIKSFASPEQAIVSFAGTWCGMEGDPAALGILTAAFEAIDGRTVVIHTEDKLIYHAAAVFASNYLVTLLDAALQAYIKSRNLRASCAANARPLGKGHHGKRDAGRCAEGAYRSDSARRSRHRCYAISRAKSLG